MSGELRNDGNPVWRRAHLRRRRFWRRWRHRRGSAPQQRGGAAEEKRGGGGGLYVPKMATGLGLFYSILRRTRPPLIPIGPWPIYKISVRPGGPSPARHPASLLGPLGRGSRNSGASERGQAPVTGSFHGKGTCVKFCFFLAQL